MWDFPKRWCLFPTCSQSPWPLPFFRETATHWSSPFQSGSPCSFRNSLASFPESVPRFLVRWTLFMLAWRSKINKAFESYLCANPEPFKLCEGLFGRFQKPDWKWVKLQVKAFFLESNHRNRNDHPLIFANTNNSICLWFVGIPWLCSRPSKVMFLLHTSTSQLLLHTTFLSENWMFMNVQCFINCNYINFRSTRMLQQSQLEPL